MISKKLSHFFKNGNKLWVSCFIGLLVLNYFINDKYSWFNIHFKTLFIVFNLGILISIDNLDKKLLRPSPSLISLFLGIFLLVIIFSNSIFDNFIYKHLDKFITPTIVLSMALINKPIKYILIFYKTFIISTLLFLFWYFYTPLTIILSPITTILSWFLLNIFLKDIQIDLSNNYLIFKKDIIEVLGTCSGINQLLLVLAILIIFLLEYNILNLESTLKTVSIAFLVPIIVNILRVILLSLITTSSLEFKQDLFIFFHKGFGSLFFSLISCTIFSRYYFSMINRELNLLKVDKK